MIILGPVLELVDKGSLGFLCDSEGAQCDCLCVQARPVKPWKNLNRYSIELISLKPFLFHNFYQTNHAHLMSNAMFNPNQCWSTDVYMLMVFHNLKATCISYEIYRKYYLKLQLTQLHLRNVYLDVINFLLCCHGALYQMWHSCQGKQLWASSEIIKKK